MMAAPNHTAHAHPISSGKILHFWTNFNYCAYYFVAAKKKGVNSNWAGIGISYLIWSGVEQYKYITQEPLGTGNLSIRYEFGAGQSDRFHSMQSWK